MDAYDVETMDGAWREELMAVDVDEMAGEEYATSEEVDEMLDELIEEADESEDFAERIRRGGAIRRRPIPMALGRTAYRPDM